MNVIKMLPVVEMPRFLSGCLRAIRGTQHYEPELMMDGALQIAHESVEERRAREQGELDTIARLQSPDSPGGRNITPAEALELSHTPHTVLAELDAANKAEGV